MTQTPQETPQQQRSSCALLAFLAAAGAAPAGVLAPGPLAMGTRLVRSMEFPSGGRF